MIVEDDTALSLNSTQYLAICSLKQLGKEDYFGGI